MAKEMKKEHEGGEKKGKTEKKHLHEIRTVAAHDGTYVHHHTYKAKKEDHHTEPERQNVATSADAEEAGQHVAEQMGMNEGGQGAEPQGGGEAEGGAEPQGGEGAAEGM